MELSQVKEIFHLVAAIAERMILRVTAPAQRDAGFVHDGFARFIHQVDVASQIEWTRSVDSDHILIRNSFIRSAIEPLKV